MGAPCPPAIKQAWIDLLGPEVVWELYGGTELQALTFISRRPVADPPRLGRRGGRRGDEGTRRRRQPLPARRGRRDLHAARPRAAHRPTATSAPRRRPGTAGTRWAISAISTPDGFLYLSDRRVDMFTVGGRNVYPAEIENALSAHPEVLSCLVVGVPDPNSGDLGQVPYALVHTADGSTLDADGRERVSARTHRGIQGAAHRRIRRHSPARRRRQGPAVGGTRRGHGAIASASASMTWPVSAGLWRRFSHRRSASRQGDSTRA